jgi:hypothetical protein
VKGARFFPEDEPELRDRLDRYLFALGARLASEPFFGEVCWLLLAGGYGRGEGGVFRAAEGAAPSLYNDLEFYLVLKDRRAWSAAASWTAKEAHRGEEETGIEIEFKLLAFAELRDAEPSMFYYDLLAAHVLVAGDEKALGNLPAILRDAARIPAHEATRLLFNRGTGLLFCRQAQQTVPLLGGAPAGTSGAAHGAPAAELAATPRLARRCGRVQAPSPA